MNEQIVTAPENVSPKNPSSPPAPSSIETPAKRGRKPGDSAGKSKTKKDVNELKFETIRILSNLPDEGKFFFIYQADDGIKDVITSWD